MPELPAWRGRVGSWRATSASTASARRADGVDQDGGRVGPVLGLAEQVGGDVDRVGRVVGDHHHLRRARPACRWRSVPSTSSLAAVTQALPGPTILSTARTDLGAVGQRGDRLRAAHDEELVDLHQAGRTEQGRGERAVTAGGSSRRRTRDARRGAPGWRS